MHDPEARREDRAGVFLRVAFGCAVGAAVAQELVTLYLYLRGEMSYFPLLQLGSTFFPGLLLGFVPAAVAIAFRRHPSFWDFLFGGFCGFLYVTVRWLAGY